MAHKKKKKKLTIYKIRPGALSEANTPPVTTPNKPPIKLWRQVNDLIKNKYYKDETDLKKEVDHIEPQSEFGKIYKKIKKDTVSYSRRELLKYYDKITRVGRTGRRKQKFRISKVPEIIPLIKDRRKINDIQDFDFDVMDMRGLVINGKRKPLTGLGLYSYMERNKINHVVDIINAWPKDKSLKVPSWKVLFVYLKTLNFTPEEVLDGAIMSSQTKKRYLEKRVNREFELNAEHALVGLIEAWQEFKKTKKAFKLFITSPRYISWCKEEDIHFSSDTHLRDFLLTCINAWNKKYPTKKIPTKLK